MMQVSLIKVFALPSKPIINCSVQTRTHSGFARTENVPLWRKSVACNFFNQQKFIMFSFAKTPLLTLFMRLAQIENQFVSLALFCQLHCITAQFSVTGSGQSTKYPLCYSQRFRTVTIIFLKVMQKDSSPGIYFKDKLLCFLFTFLAKSSSSSTCTMNTFFFTTSYILSSDAFIRISLDV